MLEGIQFDTDAADLKPSSDELLGVLQTYLEAEPELTAFIVGHTDNVGAYDYNFDLSKRRAASLVAALVLRCIDASRLTPIGIGPVSPVANNDTPEGQSKNRCVELVAR